MVIDEQVARKVLTTVDAGLCAGLGKPKPGFMCVEAAVNFALGLPHGDSPTCVGSAIRRFKIRLNDSHGWPSDEARAHGLRKLAVAQLGSDTIDQLDFAKFVTLETIKRVLPRRLRRSAKFLPNHAEAFEAAAVECEEAIDLTTARKAAENARTAGITARASAAAYVYAAAAAAAAAAADAADDDDDAADAAADAAYAARQFWHEQLLLSAQIGLESLIECKSPGCEFLFLCDAAA